MAFTKIAAAGIGSTGTVTLENLVVTGSITASLTGTATSTTNIPNLTGAITSNNTTTSLGSFSSANLATALSDKTGSGANVFATSPVLVTPSLGIATAQSLVVSGITTLGTVVVGGGTTQLIVTGNARITGILTIGTSSITLDGSNNQLNVGTGVTLHHTNGVQVGGNTLHSTGLTLNSLTATGVSTFTNGPILVGTATSTGTASQRLQVDGGAYVSGNLGIGTTNPIAKLQVVGSTELSELNLSGISSSISSTAIDVFVYDTRKDSDGGAWRKRTQNTSWYNETLNTATRGSRKDFPAVAVIVIEGTTTGSSKIKIYDGDDPDMPMWMIFNGSSQTAFTNSTITGEGSIVHPVALTSVFALNGTIAITSANYLLYLPNFISDVNIINVGEFGNYSGGFASYSLPISGRNSSGIYTRYSTQEILGASLNDVAMTVLPNAPIDPSTGLPVPTIIVGTNGGASIIKDDGTVINWLTTVGYVNQVSISKNYEIFAGGGGGIAYYAWYNKTIPTSSSNNSDAIFGTSYSSTSLPRLGSNGNSSVGHNNVFSNDTIYFSEYAGASTNNKLIILNQNTTHFGNSLVAYLTTSYNTGWMHGDIKGAWLSDTSTASVTGTELITNGNFSTSDLSAWTTIDGGTAVITGGLLKLTDTSNAFVYASAPFTTVVGKQYVVTFDIVNNGNNTANYNYVRIGNSHNSTALHDTNYGTAYGKYQVTITATATTTYITLINGLSNGLFGYWDNVSARLAEPDRSVNNNGLAVYGTITKTAVATGSNLVGYGGFSASNYLLQPQNTALDFGTGDFSIMFWGIMVPLNGTYIAFQINHVAGNTNLLMDGLGLAITIGGNNKLYQNTSSNNIGWSHQTIVRRSGILYYYSNARLITSNTSTESLVTNSSSTLKIGEGFNQYLALFRISASAPSPSQILKIYNDEKVLFQENSQCTLYGASDAVTALAYDDTTDLLSVGTSSGRSDFSGLKRINNTTTAVTTAISASNGLIAEQ